MTADARTRIFTWFRDNGFDRVGCARATAVDSRTGDGFRSWLAQGYQADMDYMERNVEKRLDPQLLLPGSKTVLVALANYYSPDKDQRKIPGQVAMYAGQRDYHKTLKKALKTVADQIRLTYPGTQTWIGVDSSPVLERYWAQQAGLGWIGKNTLLINQEIGSWTFIGCLLTTLELEADSPHTDHCGTCTRCLDVCPTNAFVGPHILDSRKCISYWTIEHRGPFDRDAYPGLHGWIFGCDECQTVCPWNRFAKPTAQPDFSPISWAHPPRLMDWIRWTPEEWDQSVTGTALRRTRYEGFMRNCQAVVDETGTGSHPEAIPA